MNLPWDPEANSLQSPGTAASVKVMSLHHDMSTTAGEEIVVYNMAESQLVREKKKR